MFSSLSEQQRRIVFEAGGKCLVRACPGSGKTYSVAARLANQLQRWECRQQGIAALSFTNIAWQTIETTLREHFEIRTPLSYPHFLGTLDSFINIVIFLPFGHLLMGCNKRPTLVGAPHGSWNSGKYERDYSRYFDLVSYGLHDELLFPKRSGAFHFGYTKFYRKDGSESQHAQHIREVKKNFWKAGYATQRDANYFGMRVLEKFPQLAASIALRFPVLIIDEAQDTSEVQMRILDLLAENGLKEIMLVGDPDQAIFEWNDAKPELFLEKYGSPDYESLELNENRRSSEAICCGSFHLSTLAARSEAVNEGVKQFPAQPEVLIYRDASIHSTIDYFLAVCQKHQIDVNPKTVAVLSRGVGLIHTIEGNSIIVPKTSPWKICDYFTKDFALGKYRYDNSDRRSGFKTIEKAFVKSLNGHHFCSAQAIEDRIAEIGFVKHRSQIAFLIKQLPETSDCSLNEWVAAANHNFSKYPIPVTLQVEREYADISFEQLFNSSVKKNDHRNYRLDTIHSVKGETFEAVLLFLKKRGNSKEYRTLLSSGVSPAEDEDLRIVYVGMTRPRKILLLAVPDEQNRAAWKDKLSIV